LGIPGTGYLGCLGSDCGLIESRPILQPSSLREVLHTASSSPVRADVIVARTFLALPVLLLRWRRSRHSCLTMAALLVGTCPFPVSATAGHAKSAPSASGEVVSSSVRAGIRMTIVIPGTIFPRGALVRVHLAATNVSSHEVTLLSVCHVGPLQVRVTDQAGDVRFPPVFRPDQTTAPLCLPPTQVTLRPGETVSRYRLVLLRGALVTERIAFSDVHGSRLISGTPLRAKLSRSDGPSVAVRGGTQVKAVVRWHGSSLPADLFQDWTVECPPVDSSVRVRRDQASFGWERIHAPRSTRLLLVPKCPMPMQWHVFVAVLGHTPGAVDYSMSR
jgi:hypothetical protein